MYGFFYAKKNNKTIVLFLFKSKNNKNNTIIKEIKINDWNSIKEFDENVKKIIKNKCEEILDHSFKIFYRNIEDNKHLKLIMKELNITNNELNNPLVKISNLDIEINNISNFKIKKYERN